MDNVKSFLVLRYSLVEDSQQAFEPEPLPVPKGLAVIEALLGDRNFSHKRVDYSFVGFKEAVPTPQFEFPAKRFYVGKTAKRGRTHVGEKIPGDILEYQADDWIPLITLFDTEDQYIFVQKDWRFGNEELISQAIQAGLRSPLLSTYNHRIFVEPKTHTEWFWRVIGEHHKIFKVQLKLISPNILQTNIKARDALSALENVFNQDEVTITLESEAGEITVPQNPTSDYLDYIGEGEGSWKVTTEGKRGGKKTFSSAQSAEIVKLPVPHANEAGDQQQLDIEGRGIANARVSYDALLAAEAFSILARELRRK